MEKWKIEKYKKISKEVRREILEMVYRTKSPHIGSSLSLVEILVALYFRFLRISPKNPRDKFRDRLILSKGHACHALYATLFKRGFLDRKVLNGFAIDGGTLAQHPNSKPEWGIEISTGSLGHGLSIGAGMALAQKHDKLNSRTFVIMGDGELEEGSIWEAAMFAAHHKLDNLVGIVDNNQLQFFGRTKEIVSLEPLSLKWQAFGWEVREVDGHDFKGLIATFKKIPFKKGKPSLVLAHTTKGKGISFMEDNYIWHSKYPDEEEYRKALKELL